MLSCTCLMTNLQSSHCNVDSHILCNLFFCDRVWQFGCFPCTDSNFIPRVQTKILIKIVNGLPVELSFWFCVPCWRGTHDSKEEIKTQLLKIDGSILAYLVSYVTPTTLTFCHISLCPFDVLYHYTVFHGNRTSQWFQLLVQNGHYRHHLCLNYQREILKSSGFSAAQH